MLARPRRRCPGETVIAETCELWNERQERGWSVTRRREGKEEGGLERTASLDAVLQSCPSLEVNESQH